MKQLDLLRKLTDVFTKNPESNIGKLFLIVSEQFTNLEAAATQVENWRDIDQAEGATLDLVGAARGQQRGKLSDELMRVLIKARIARNNSDGTIDSMINSLALTLDTPASEINIKPLWEYGTHNKISSFNSGDWALHGGSVIVADYKLEADQTSMWSDIGDMKWSDM